MRFNRIINLVRTRKEWETLIANTNDLRGKVLQNLNFTEEELDWNQFEVKGTTFLACDFKKQDAISIINRGAIVYPKFRHLPYNPHRTELYNWQELLKKSNSEMLTADEKIYRHFVQTRYNPPMDEAMAQRIHDYSIDVALRNIIEYDDSGMTQKKIVGFMGGHSTRRGSKYYRKVAYTARELSSRGYFVATGGGPGIMEAANLGAYFGDYSKADLKEAINILSNLKDKDKYQLDYHCPDYFEKAEEVAQKFPNGKESMAIPTWFYGHEPSNLFACHIAKYFSNSIREDTLLSICLYGIIFAPGSAGTTQEIFQEAAQNHYGTSGYYSPMVFLGKKRYVEDTALYSVLHQISVGRVYKKLLYLTDDPGLAVNFIENHPPIPI